MSGCIMNLCTWGLLLLIEALSPQTLTLAFRVAQAARMPDMIIQPRTNTRPVSLLFVGDVMLARNLPPYCRYDPRPLDYNLLFSATASYLTSADIAFCNLECPISGNGDRLDKEFAFNAPPEAAKALSDAGFDVVSLANNHCLDYGIEALKDTREHLTQNGVSYIGVIEKNIRQTPVVIERDGVKVAYLAYITSSVLPGVFYSFDSGPARARTETIIADIAKVRDQADIVVVSLHWGMNYVSQPNSEQRVLGRALIDAGADIVAGHHPHVQQEPEFYRSGLIIYSMGNFVFARYSKPSARSTRLYRVHVTRQGIRDAEYLPLEIIGGSWWPQPKSETFVSIPKPCGTAAPACSTAAPGCVTTLGGGCSTRWLLAAKRILDPFFQVYCSRSLEACARD